MNGELFVQILYVAILYTTLGMVVIPVFFFFLWTFFDFWKKHIGWFYVLLVGLYVGAIAAFYFTQQYWTFWYYAFPAWSQIVGLVIYLFAGLSIKVAQNSITIPVRFFYPLLKGEKFHLRTDGIYKHLRHPMYALFPWAVFGVLLYTGQLILAPVFLFLLVARSWWAKKEEAHLKKTVIGDYDKYMKQTPNRFYPKLF